MNNPNAQVRSSRLLTLIATILIVAMLYLARAVLIPIALAILLCFLLGPLVDRLERRGAGRITSVLAVTLLSFALIGGVGYVVASEAMALADSLPQHRHNIREKLRAIATPGVFTRARQAIEDVTEEAIKASTQPETAPSELSAVSQRPSGETRETQPDAPMKVELAEPPLNPFQQLASTISPFFAPLGTAGIVIVFVIFMLIQREDLRDRIIRLVGASQITFTTQVIDDAAKRVSRYLLMQFIVNVTYGIPIGLGLWSIGVPNAALWGVLCMVFRYIPYIGPWIGAAMPILLSLAVSDGWTQPLLVVGLFVVVELISNNVIEPWLYGSHTGVSPVAVLVAAVFWTWLWGIPGLVLATPMTVCVVVLGRHLPQMEWLAVLLGDEPGLPLPARIYQRLLAMDHEETFNIAEEYLKSHTLLEWYDDGLIPALALAEHDRHRGQLDEAREQAVYSGIRSLIEELGERFSESAASDSSDTAAIAPATRADQPLIMIVAARDQADELSAFMLCQLLTREGLRCEMLPASTLASEAGNHVSDRKPAAICISAMPPMAVAHARYVCKRIHGALPSARIVVGLWHAIEPQRAAGRLKSCGAGGVVATFSEAIEYLRG